MMRTLVTLVAGIVLCVGVVLASTPGKVKGRYEKPFAETGVVREIPSRPMPAIDRSMFSPNTATSTTLTGWYDYQSKWWLGPADSCESGKWKHPCHMDDRV